MASGVPAGSAAACAGCRAQKERQAWADGQNAPDARGDTEQREDEAGSSTEATAGTGRQSPPHGDAATRDTQTNTGGNNVNNNRPKRGLNTVVSYDETNRRTRRRTPQEREAYIRDRKRKNVALIPTGARIVHMRTDDAGSGSGFIIRLSRLH